MLLVGPGEHGLGLFEPDDLAHQLLGDHELQLPGRWDAGVQVRGVWKLDELLRRADAV